MNETTIINILNNFNKTKEEIEYINNNYDIILRTLFKEADEDTFAKLKNIIKNNKFFDYFTKDLYYFQPIQTRSLDKWKEKEIVDSEIRKEPLVALNKYDYSNNEFISLHPRIFVDPVYFKDHRKGTYPEIYVREQVLESLLTHLELLPKEYGFIIYDGYRTYECQKELYEEVLNKKLLIEKSKFENQTSNNDALIKHIETYIMPYYVSYPSYNPPSPHNTGGAIDLMICDNKGQALNYGCKFDKFDKIANLNFFETKLKEEHQLTDTEIEYLIIRRITCNLLKYPTKSSVNSPKSLKKNSSFSEFAGEYWHFDINNQWDMNLEKALYGSCQQDNILPDPNYTIIEYINKYHQ